MPADRGRIVGRQHPGAMRLEHGIGYSCGLGRSTERPAEMLARMAAADGAAVVREHLVVKAIDDRELAPVAMARGGNDFFPGLVCCAATRR